MVLTGGVLCHLCKGKGFKTPHDLHVHMCRFHGIRTRGTYKRITVSLDEAVLRALDVAVGDGKRSAFVETAIKQALEAKA